MGILIILVAIIFLSLFVPTSNKKKGFLGALLALLYFPFGVIFALAKKYK